MSLTIDPPKDTPATSASRPRAIIHRTRGHRGGPITRLASPGDLGQLMMPFVFLDLFEMDGARAPSLDTGWHPHSGLATVTVVLDGTTRYAETTGNTGALPSGGSAYFWISCPGSPARTFYASSCDPTSGVNLSTGLNVSLSYYSGLRPLSDGVCNDDTGFSCGNGSSLTATAPATT